MGATSFRAFRLCDRTRAFGSSDYELVMDTYSSSTLSNASVGLHLVSIISNAYLQTLPKESTNQRYEPDLGIEESKRDGWRQDGYVRCEK